MAKVRDRVQAAIQGAVSAVFGKSLESGFGVVPVMPEQARAYVKAHGAHLPPEEQEERMRQWENFQAATALHDFDFWILEITRRLDSKKEKVEAATRGGFQAVMWTDGNGTKRFMYGRFIGVLVVNKRVSGQDIRPEHVILPGGVSLSKEETEAAEKEYRAAKAAAEKKKGAPLTAAEDRRLRLQIVHRAKVAAYMRNAEVHEGGKQKKCGGNLPRRMPFPPGWVPIYVEEARKVGIFHSCVVFVPLDQMLPIATMLSLDKKFRLPVPGGDGSRRTVDGIRPVGSLTVSDMEKFRSDWDTAFGQGGRSSLAAKLICLTAVGIVRPEASETFNNAFREMLRPRARRFVFRGAKVVGRDVFVGSQSFSLDDPFFWTVSQFIAFNGWGGYDRQTVTAISSLRHQIYLGGLDIGSRNGWAALMQEARRDGLDAKDLFTKAEKLLGGQSGAFFYDRELWRQYWRRLLRMVRERRMKEIRAEAAGNRWTTADAEKEAGQAYWKDLDEGGGFCKVSEETEQKYFIGTRKHPGFYRLAYEVVERERVFPKIAEESFGSKDAEDLIGKGLYEHLPSSEKAAKKGWLKAVGTLGDVYDYQDVTLHVNARIGKTDAVVKALAFPPDFMPLKVQDWLRHVLMGIGWYDVVEMDSIIGPVAKALALAFAKDEKVNAIQNFVMGRILSGGGAADQMDTIYKVLGEIAAEILESSQPLEEGKNLKASAERWWRAMAWSRYYLMDRLFARFDVESHLAERWVRIALVDSPAVMEGELGALESIRLYGLREIKGKANGEYDASFDRQAVEEAIDQKFASWGVQRG